MTFGNIYWLYAFLPILVILLLSFCYAQKTRHLLLKSFAAPGLLPSLTSSYSNRRYVLKFCLFLAALFFIFAALSQPQWGYTWEDQKAKGIDILFALDVSKSMLAPDIKPNRLERAKYSILDLVKKLEGNRFGLIAFSSIAFLQCPLTLDYNAFTECLKQTDPGVLNRGGTDISAAIRTAIPVFSKENNFKILILISDGEDLEESGITAAHTAAKDNITIYTVGVGTSTGELIPIKTSDNSTDFVRDTQGKIVKTKLDEQTLSKIAQATGGFYTPLGTKGEGLEKIYQSAINNIPKQELTSTLRQVPTERFQWPLAIAIILFTASILLSTRTKSIKNISNLLLIVFLFNWLSSNLNASPSKAFKAFESNQFASAAHLYEVATQKNSNHPTLNYNLGTSLYKNQNYTAALSAFNKAIKTQDLPLQQKTFYNIGNTLYRQGQETMQTNPQSTIKLWEDAINNYQSSLELDPTDLHAQENINFVKKTIEELKKNQEQQKQNQEQQKQQEPQNDDNQQQANNNQQQNNGNKQQDNNNNQKSSSNSQQDSQNKDSETSNSLQQQELLADEDTQKQDQQQTHQPNQEKNQQQTNNESNTNAENSKNSQTQEAKQISATATSIQPMSKEEAEELLKSFKSSEKKLPIVNEKSNHPFISSDNFKDW